MNGALLLVTSVCLLLLSSLSHGLSPMERCLIDSMAALDDNTTVAELKVICEGETLKIEETTVAKQDVPVYEYSALQERLAAESTMESGPFVITPHNPNYILYTYFDDPNQAPFEEARGVSDAVEDTEMKFQVSFKAPIWRNVLGTGLDGYFAYTSTSWWQLFNDDISSPFRETNYEPEFFVRSVTPRKILGANVSGWSLGFNHESNGRSDPLSRSWNRIIGRAGIDVTNNLTLLTRLWYRIPEDDDDDDNPFEYKYLGYGDVRAIWAPNRHTVTAMVRPGTEKTSFEVTWSHPINDVFRVYAQYYNGYGESLLDYDYRNKRIGIGISMNDFLQRQ